jgi:tetratricopeptide (TPR) repeat protein
MAFSIRCRCGQTIPVEASQAGLTVRCACGELCAVPPLSEIQFPPSAGIVPQAVEEATEEKSRGNQPLPEPGCQVVLLTPSSETTPRINLEAFRHFVAAMVRQVEEFFEKLPKGQGLDLRLALALLPDGKRLVDVAARPDRLGAPLEELRRQLEELPAPPVRRGPVAFLAHTLIWGGSDDPNESFRHRFGPYYRGERPAWFDAAVAEAERSGMPRSRPLSLWERSKAGAIRVFAAMRRGLKREVLPQPRPAAPSPTERANLIGAQAAQYGVEWAIEQITALIHEFPLDAELYGRRGDLYQEKEQYEQAIADYTELVGRSPHHARGYLVRGTCHRHAGNMEPALADFNEALWRQPTCAQALAERSWIYFELGAVDRALADVATAMEYEPDDPRLAILRGRMLAMQGNLDPALEDFSLAVRLDPHNAEAFFFRGHAYRDRRGRGGQGEADNRAAVADLTAGLRLSPEYVLGYAYRAESRLLDGDIPGALADCEEALRRDPECALAYAIRGAARHRRGEHRLAIDDCSEAIDRGIDGALVRLTRAEAYAAEDEWDSALSDCAAALDCAPEHPGAHALRARIYTQLGSLDEALEDAETAVRLAPEWNVPFGVRGNVHGLRGDHQQAIEDLSEALRLEPEDSMARYNRAIAWCYQEEFQKAIEDFNACAERGEGGAAVFFGRASAWLHQGDADKARADLDEALRLDPEFAPAYFSRGNLFMQRGDYDAAKGDFDELVRRCPELAFAYAARANAWAQKGDHEKAAEDYQEAIRLDPGSAEGFALQRLIVEATFHFRKEEYPRAIALADEAIELEPDCAPAYSIRGAAWWYSEHQVEAVDAFTRLLEVAGDSFAGYCNRGQVYAEMGEYDKALEDLNRALELGASKESAATLVAARSGRALAYAGLGRYDEADRDFEQSIADCPANAWAHYNRGLTHHQRGNTAAAAESFRRALEASESPLSPRKRDRARAYLRRL